MEQAATKPTFNDGADFDIRGTVERIHRAPKATFLTIKSNRAPDYPIIDVVCFHGVSKIQKGDRVHVTGRIGMEKSGAKQVGRDGREWDKWVPRLKAEVVELLSEVQARIPGTGAREAPANDNADIDDIPF